MYFSEIKLLQLRYFMFKILKVEVADKKVLKKYSLLKNKVFGYFTVYMVTYHIFSVRNLLKRCILPQTLWLR